MRGRRRPFSLAPMLRGYKGLLIALIVVSLVVAEAGRWLLDRPSNTDCPPYASADRKITEVRAIGAMVRPWRGPHRVYGLFDVPTEFVETKGYAVTISVKGVPYYCMWVATSLKQNGRVVSAEAGRYLVREYVPTRVTLWFLANGLFHDLRRPENWAIVFTEKPA